MKQKRRQFIKTSAALGIGLPFLGCSSEMAESIKQSKYLDTIGLQLWTVRNQLEKDFAGTIKKLAEQGYRQIETMNIEQALKATPIAKEVGLKIKSTHIPSAYLTERWEFAGNEPKSFDRFLENAVKHNFEHLIVAYLHDGERSLDDYKKLIEGMNREGEKCKKAGITLGYHNHNFEFAEIEGVLPYDLMMKEVDPKNAKFELDVFWASIAGKNPVELMKKMKGQISLLHLKDKKKGAVDTVTLSGITDDTYKELGNGEVDIKAVVELAEATGVEYCYVEQDQSPDPIASTKTSIDWLKKTV